MIDSINAQVTDADDHAHYELDDYINVTPLARASIHESHILTPYQEIFIEEIDSST